MTRAFFVGIAIFLLALPATVQASDIRNPIAKDQQTWQNGFKSCIIKDQPAKNKCLYELGPPSIGVSQPFTDKSAQGAGIWRKAPVEKFNSLKFNQTRGYRK